MRVIFCFLIAVAQFACMGCIAVVLFASRTLFAAEPNSRPPHVILILADDLGYGDTGCYGADPKHVRTPNLDRLSREGLRFTDGHAAASVCTPSRYSLLTGEYAFRNPLASTVIPGNAPLSIKPGTYTLPEMFRSRGYRTGLVGKWHLGLAEGGKTIRWNGEIKPGPLETGFDEAFYFPATNDRVPTVYVRNHTVVDLDPTDPIEVSYKERIGGEPTGAADPDLAAVLKGFKGHGHDDTITAGVSRIGFMSGGKAARWKDDEMSDVLAREAIRFVEKNKDQPFFLYYATHGIHEPRIPNARFRGKSGAGTYGDHIEELDDAVGQLMSALDRLKLTKDTLLVFSSDNGGCTWFGYDYGEHASLNGHKVNGVLRGEKGSAWEGGTREPFIVRWPGHVPAGQTSPALVSQTDLLASLAHLTGATLPIEAARDSMDVLDALLGKTPIGRHELVEHLAKDTCALRVDNWKWFRGELYNLANDLPETNNLAKQESAQARKMWARLKELTSASRTRP